MRSDVRCNADVCSAQGIEWLTIDADFGVGVAVPRPATWTAATDAPWTLATHDDYVARYLADPYSLMRVVSSEDAWQAIDRALAGEPVEDLLAAFPGWDATLEPTAPDGRAARSGLPERELMARMVTGIKDDLNRERAHEPTWRELGYHALRRLGLR